MTGQKGKYEWICEILAPRDMFLFKSVALTFDMDGRLGFVLLIQHEDPEVLKCVQQALAVTGEQKLLFVERFKIPT